MKKRKVPHTFVIVFAIIVVAAVLTWIIPPGKYVSEQVNGETVMRFYYADQLSEAQAVESHAEPQTWQVFSAFFKGFVKQSNIIVFILIIGGAFWIMNKSRAIDMGIHSFLRFTKRLEHNRLIRKIGVNNIVIILVMLLFSLFGSVFGMSEETIAFALIIIPLAISMGYDSIVGLCMVYVAAHIGFSGAMLNPFTIGIAQGIAEIPLFTGLGYRAVCWAILTVVGIVFVLWYANKVKKNPQSSIMYEDDAYWRTADDQLSTLNAQLSTLSQPDFSGKEYLLQRQLQTEARGDIIQKLREAGIRPTAMMDISDGLSSELMHICKQSGCGCRVFEKELPIDYQTAVMAEEMEMNVTTCALNGGEDYELLFTVPIGDLEKVKAIEDIHLIGHITEQKFGQVLVTRDGQEFELKAQGWNPLGGEK